MPPAVLDPKERHEGGVVIKRILVLILVIGVAGSFTACEKKEEKPLLPPGHPSMGSGMPSDAGKPAAEVRKLDRTITVPKEVALKWPAVSLAVEDKVAKTKKEYTVAVGSELTVPNTKVRIKVLAFLPDFRMGDSEITSVSDKPNNPAVQVVVTEPGKQEWKGWLYSLHPNIHPYPHERLAIILVGGVSK
jgi:hypothetical protein